MFSVDGPRVSAEYDFMIQATQVLLTTQVLVAAGSITTRPGSQAHQGNKVICGFGSHLKVIGMVGSHHYA